MNSVCLRTPKHTAGDHRSFPILIKVVKRACDQFFKYEKKINSTKNTNDFEKITKNIKSTITFFQSIYLLV